MRQGVGLDSRLFRLDGFIDRELDDGVIGWLREVRSLEDYQSLKTKMIEVVIGWWSWRCSIYIEVALFDPY